MDLDPDLCKIKICLHNLINFAHRDSSSHTYDPCTIYGNVMTKELKQIVDFCAFNCHFFTKMMCNAPGLAWLA